MELPGARAPVCGGQLLRALLDNRTGLATPAHGLIGRHLAAVSEHRLHRVALLVHEHAERRLRLLVPWNLAGRDLSLLSLV